jgi:hypothetical protein
MSNILHLRTIPAGNESIHSWEMQASKCQSAIEEIARHKKNLLQRQLRASSFDVHQLPPFVVSVITKKDVRDLSLKGITQTNHWIEKIVLINKEYSQATFIFSKKDYQNFFLLKMRLFVWFSQFLPRELTFNALESQPTVPSSDQDCNILSGMDSVLVRVNRAFSPQKFNEKKVYVSESSGRRYINHQDNTSSSLGSFFYFDGQEMFNDSKSLVSLQSIESSNELSPFDCAKNQAFEDRLRAHLEKRLLLFYASTVATCNQIENFPFCEIGIGKTTYQIGKGNSQEDGTEKFDAAHSAIIPNIVIKIDQSDFVKNCPSLKAFLGAKNDLLSDIDQQIASFDPKANDDHKIANLKCLKENILKLTSISELKRLLNMHLAFLPSIKIFKEATKNFTKDIDQFHARFNQQTNDAKKIADLQRLKENIFKSNNEKDLLKSFSLDIIESLFSKSLVLDESYLGQNLASTVCLPELYNKFDGEVEDKLRTKAKDILNHLFKGGVNSPADLNALMDKSKKFNKSFETTLREIIAGCVEKIQSSNIYIGKIKEIDHIINLIDSQDLEKVKAGIRLFQISFNFYAGINRNQSDIIKNLAFGLSAEMVKRIKKKTLDFLQPAEHPYLESIFNFDLIDSIDKKRMKDIYLYIFLQFDDIFSQSPFHEHIDVQKALRKIEDEFLKEEPSLVEIKDIWDKSIKLIKLQRLFFWFSDGEYSKEKVIGLFKKYLENQETKDELKKIIKSEGDKKTIQESYLHLAKFYLKSLGKKADFLVEDYFESLNPKQCLDLRSQFIAETCKDDRDVAKASCGSSFEMPKGLEVLQSIENQVIQIAQQNLLKPYVELVPVKSSAFMPKLCFLNIPIFFVLKRVVDSAQYPNGLKLIIDKPKYFKAPLFAQNLKAKLREIADGMKVELKVGQSIYGIFSV